MNAEPRWYAIHQASDDSTAEVHIYDEIGGFGVGAKQFVSAIKPFSGKRLHLRINSVGGSVIEGLAIANAIRRHKGGVTAHVDGLAASMASVIAVAADETVMADNALMMIHEPWTVGMGTSDDLRKEADVLDTMRKNIIRAYARKTKMDGDEIAEMMKAETWLDAAAAVNAGFADEIEDGIEAAASITPAAARERVAAFMSKQNTPPAPEPVDTAEEAMNAELQAKVDEMQAKLTAAEQEKAELTAATAQASEAVTAELETLKAEISRLTNDVAIRDAEIAKLQSEAKSAGEQAAAIVAGMGMDPNANQPAAETRTPAQIFATLDGPEAVSFFRANRREILATATIS